MGIYLPVPFCPCLMFKRCPSALILSPLVPPLGSLTTSVLVLIPVMRSSWSLEFLSVMTSLVFETLNSSSAEESGSFKMVVFPESQMLVKQGGTLSHLLRYLLTVRSSTSAAVVGIL